MAENMSSHIFQRHLRKPPKMCGKPEKTYLKRKAKTICETPDQQAVKKNRANIHKHCSDPVCGWNVQKNLKYF